MKNRMICKYKMYSSYFYSNFHHDENATIQKNNVSGGFFNYYNYIDSSIRFCL